MSIDAVRQPAGEPSSPRGRPFSRDFQSALSRATSNVTGLATFIGTLTALVAAFYVFHTQLGLSQLWAGIICAAAILAFFLLAVLPDWRDELRLERMRVAGISGRLLDPSYFRLIPYEADDQQRFKRPDSAAEDAKKWIDNSQFPILYLSGQSGVGKSSLINAAIAPGLSSAGWVVVRQRLYDDPFAALPRGLLRPGIVWQKPPTDATDARDLFERAAERVSGEKKRLLLIIDQFEESLILCGEPVKKRLAALLLDLVARPVSAMTILLALRAEYLNDLMELGLPPPAFGPGQIAFEVRPFTRVAAQSFIEDSGLNIGADLLEKVLQEAAEIEDMLDRVRPIVLNFFGLVISSFKGALPKGVEAGRFLSGYVLRSMNDPAARGFAVRILRPLVSDAGTKRALTTDRIADAAGVPTLATRGCLIPLANDGLVRRLDGAPERWEVAHDFVARLLQPLLRNWRKSAWEAARPWLVPISLAIWLVGLGGALFLYPTLHDEYVLNQLRTVGLVPGRPVAGGGTFLQNGTPVRDATSFWRTATQMQGLSFPVVELTIDGQEIANLQGMPALPALRTLNLSALSGLTSTTLAYF